jgi:hypothetical protein
MKWFLSPEVYPTKLCFSSIANFHYEAFSFETLENDAINISSVPKKSPIALK